LALDEPNDQDERVTLEGLEILVDKRAAPYVEGSVVDYVDSLWGKGFTIRPAYGGSC
jgi:Fe-S cluster assembly iron-binding protein IscA